MATFWNPTTSAAPGRACPSADLRQDPASAHPQQIDQRIRGRRLKPQFRRCDRVLAPDTVLAINAIGCTRGLPAISELVPRGVETDRWSFLCVIAPLRLPAVTGSPVNPIAIQ